LLLVSGSDHTHRPLPAAAQQTERGTFHLYKLQNRVGREMYEVRRAGDTLITSTTAEWNFIGTPVRLSATLRTTRDRAPLHLVIRGALSTRSDINLEVTVAGGTSAVRERGVTRTVAAINRAGLTTHYPPLAIEQALLRRWHSLGRPDSLSLLPTGALRVTTRGRDTVQMQGRPIVLERLSVHGVIWGLQSVWLDTRQNLIAVVGADAELDRFEGIREGYEHTLPLFVRRSVSDAMADLSARARTVQPVAEGRLAMRVGVLIDGTERAPIQDAVVLIENGLIRAVGARAQVQIPAGFREYDASEFTAIPGLFDMHGHYQQVEWAPAGLAAGVTTVRDAANELELATALRDAIERGPVLGPRMVLAGYIDGGQHPLGSMIARTADQARALVRRYHEAGYQQIKIYQSLPPAFVPVIAEEAHRLQMTVTGHVPTGMNALEFVRAGADQINHLGSITSVLRPSPQPGAAAQAIDLNSAQAQEAIRIFIERRTVLDPSLARAEQQRHVKGRAFSTVEPGAASAPRELRFSLDNVGLSEDAATRAQPGFQRSLQIMAALHKAGIPIVLGTDLVVPGHSIHRELELAVLAGLTPLQALQAATIVPARALGLEREAGSIETSKRADIVLVRGDPLRSISDTRNVAFVMTRGRLYPPVPLWAMAGFRPALSNERNP
ncbi:MAG: amidohydrolase family protein, partial [Longimicrobiales bacterium]